MGALIGNNKDEAAPIEYMFVGAADLATYVRKVYIGNSDGEAVLVWEESSDD